MRSTLNWIAVAAVSFPAVLSAQENATVRVRVIRENVPLAGASVRVDSIIQTTTTDGGAVFYLQPGEKTLIASRIGYIPDTVALVLRAAQDTTVEISLHGQPSGIDAVIVSTTRAERRVEDTPLRVEVIDDEEVAEKAAMTPGDIAMMMNETSGLRVATTSPSLGGANVRIQGLRGRYTLMLMDGLPLVGAQGGFGLLQIPAVDLARVEVIKGTASALYGPAALGGVVNLVPRRPDDETQREIMLNQTSRGGTDAIFYTSGRLGEESPLGASLLASGHRQSEKDIDGDGWADLAGYERAVVRPRFFYDRDGRSLFVTAGYTGETREGGTLPGQVTPDGTAYEEGLNTRRFDGGVVGRALVGGRDILAVRVSFSGQNHEHTFGTVREDDTHRTAFGEVAATLPRGRWTLVGGSAFQSDSYRNKRVSQFDFDYRAPSLFAQVDVDAASWLVLSGSGRADWHNVYSSSVNPRLSALFRVPRGWTVRLSGGSGTFAPSPLTEETEATGLSPLEPLDGLRRERALSGSIDVNGHVETNIGEFEFGGSMYASRINDAVIVRDLTILMDGEAPALELVNAPLPSRTAGAEALVRWLHENLRLTATYAYLHATEWSPDGTLLTRRDVPLAPRHTAGLVGSFEREDESRIGIEVYYTGRQALENNPYRDVSRPYVVVGMLVERQLSTPIGRARVFVNAENVGNVRQTHFDPLVRPTRGPGGRWTTDAWTELAGTTINGGVRISF